MSNATKTPAAEYFNESSDSEAVNDPDFKDNASAEDVLQWMLRQRREARAAG